MQLCIANKGEYFEHLMKLVFCKDHLFNKKGGVPGTFGSPYIVTDAPPVCNKIVNSL